MENYRGILWLMCLVGLLSSAQSVCVTKPKASQSGSNPSTSIRVHWEWDTTTLGCIQADDINIRYVLTNRDQCEPMTNSQPVPIDVNGPERFVKIDSLLPYSTYTITYELYLGGNVVENSNILIETAHGNLGIPENIQNIYKSENRLIFSWSKVPCGKMQGPISSYNLRLKEAEKPDIFTFIKNIPVDTTEHPFDGRDPFTEYIFEMQSVAAGAGGLGSAFSSPLHVRTLGKNIPAPLGLTAAEYDTYIMFSWTPVDCTETADCTSVNGYVYTFESADGTDTRTGSVHGDNHVTLSNISICTKYFFRVGADTDAGTGRMSSQSTMITAFTEPTNLRAPDSDIDSITIEWESPNLPGSCADLKITGYEIEIMNDTWTETIPLLLVNRYEIYNLVGHQTYKIRIKTIFGEAERDSEWSQAISKTTLEDDDTSTDAPSSSSWSLYIGVAIGSLVLLLIIIGIVVNRCKKFCGTTAVGFDERRLRESTISMVSHQRIFINFIDEDERSEYANFKDGSMDPSYWEIPWENLHLEGSQLGRGHFGIVQSGHVLVGNVWILVAFKTLPETASEQNKRNFNNELELMMKIGRHKNITSLVGSCVNGGIKYMILEYANLGDLRNFLKDSRLRDASGPSSTLDSKQLMNLARDVASGMQFLAENNIIHRDLAARNVLVHRDCDESLVAKVSDFGLSREDEDYTQTSRDPLPIRWMAIESLERKMFSTQSDVWSFGILLWEIFTLGALPYSLPEKVEQRDLLLYLQDNNRMEKPENCDHEMYNLMLRCWGRVPDGRPSFSDIIRKLGYMIENEDVYVITAINNQAYIDSDTE